MKLIGYKIALPVNSCLLHSGQTIVTWRMISKLKCWIIGSPPIRFCSWNQILIRACWLLIVVSSIWWRWWRYVFDFTNCVFQNSPQLLHLSTSWFRISPLDNKNHGERENISCNLSRIIASLSGLVETMKRHDETMKRQNGKRRRTDVVSDESNS